LIIPRSEAEAKKIADLVQKNIEAEDWVSDDIMFSPLKPPKNEVVDDLLKRVGDTKLPLKK
jgi:hypothetical protein